MRELLAEALSFGPVTVLSKLHYWGSGDMDWVELLSRPDWATVITSVGLAVIAAFGSASIAWATLKRTYKLEDQTEAVLRKLLRHPDYKMRSLTQLQHHVPLSDDKLSEALLRAGAVSFKNSEGTVLWGLVENHRDKVFPKKRRQT